VNGSNACWNMWMTLEKGQKHLLGFNRNHHHHHHHWCNSLFRSFKRFYHIWSRVHFLGFAKKNTFLFTGETVQPGVPGPCICALHWQSPSRPVAPRRRCQKWRWESTDLGDWVPSVLARGEARVSQVRNVMINTKTEEPQVQNLDVQVFFIYNPIFICNL
jgi:hypothetical protein